MFKLVIEILAAAIGARDKDDARSWFYKLRQNFLDYNGSEWRSERFAQAEKGIRSHLAERAQGADPRGARLIGRLE